MKYTKLKLSIRKNIPVISLLLLGYSINIDTLIINLLRHGFSKFPLEHKYFKEYKGAIPFIKFHHKERCNIPLSTTCTTLITYDMETDILFISTVEKHLKFYISSFIKKYADKAEEILIFINGKNLTGENINCLIKNLNKVLGQDIDTNLNINKRLHREDDLQVKTDINLQETNLIQTPTTKSILANISELSFPEYYLLITKMKNTKIPFIDPKIYRNAILTSFSYDNYVQVYLWKILVYQKIIFEIEIEIEESDLKTEEALEGYDIYLNIH